MSVFLFNQRRKFQINVIKWKQTHTQLGLFIYSTVNENRLAEKEMENTLKQTPLTFWIYRYVFFKSEIVA